MANLSYTNTPLIADLYDTPEAALAASAKFGCSGYRTYNINGETKYVPCSTYLAYEQAIRYYKYQGQLVTSGKGIIGDKAVGLQFANAKDEIGGDPFFTLGNFSISTSVTQKSQTGKNTNISPANKSYTASSIYDLNPNPATKSNTVKTASGKTVTTVNSNSLLDQINQKIDNNLTVTVLFDTQKLESYVHYSSMKEIIKNTIIEITQKFPAAIKANIIGLTSPTVTQYNYSVVSNTSEFKVNLNNLYNPFNIEYTISGSTVVDDVNIAPVRNFSKHFTDYTIYYNDTEYNILNANLPNATNDFASGLFLTVKGNPFSGITNNDLTVNTTFLIKPKMSKYDEFQNSLSDMGKFLMNYNYDTKQYKANIRYTKTNDNGIDLNINEQFIFPKIDDYNIDIFSNDFDLYLTKLNNVADDFDATKTNLISRFLTTDSLKEFDTPDRKINMMFNLMGKNFDVIRKYVDGITFMTNLSYDKVENIPDLLTKNFGNMLGFETYNIEDENTIIESLFNIKDFKIEPGYTPAEIDIELWRRIFINAYYLWKSKGTRKSIEFILKLVGLPEAIFEIDEHIYMARHKINYTQKAYELYGNTYSDATILTLVPFDTDGFPTVPTTVKYQESGFSVNNDNKNFGPYDFGKSYINAYERQSNVPLFVVDRYVDNVKSWVYNEGTTTLRTFEDVVGYTEYYEDDSRLVINSKELEVYIASDKIFDLAVYRYYNRNNINLNTDLNFRDVADVTPGTLTFNQFLQKSLDEYIKPDNRKTVKTYATLSKIYYDYLKLNTTSPISYTKDLQFLNNFDGSWVKLVQQFTPATTILNAGKKIQNSQLLDNKFVYKHGLNSNVNWLGTDGSEYQDLAKRPVNQGTTTPASSLGYKHKPRVGYTSSFDLVGKKGKNYSGYDPTINEYFGFYYGLEDACNSIKIYDWKEDINYGNDNIYGGNINEGYFDGFGVGDNTVGPNYYPISRTITIPDGPGTYQISFLRTIDDDIYFYDGPDSGGSLIDVSYYGDTGYTNVVTITTNQITFYNNLTYGADVVISELFVQPTSNSYRYGVFLTYDNNLYRLNTNKTFVAEYLSNFPIHIDTTSQTDNTPDKLKINNQFVYEKINLDVDIETITFNDVAYGTLSDTERKYYKEAIAIGQAYLATKSDFICPIPKPHTCYYDFSGQTISLGSQPTYYDETYKELKLNQSKYYGYSKNTATTKPDDAVYGYSGNWVVPYRKNNPWTNGVTYYKNDIVSYTSTNYIVTGTTAVGTASTPTGVTTTTIVPGQYQNFLSRTKTDPYMHINTAYIDKVILNKFTTNDHVSFNLSKLLYLYQVYSGATPLTTYKVVDNILNDELFISDSSSLTFDGFYSLDEAKIGPFYTANSTEIATQTLIESLYLAPDKDNYINFESINTNFGISDTNIGLSNGYYLIKGNSYFKFDIDLYFESDLVLTQTVNIKLLNQFGDLIHAQQFNFSGADPSALRVVNFTHEGIFYIDSRVYLAVEPVTHGCTLSRYETIDIDYTNDTIYSSINDPRFRVYFNGGRALIDRHYTDDVLSIEPIGYNASSYSVEQYIFKKEDSLDISKFKSKPVINQSYDETYNFGLLYGLYYEKFKLANPIGDVTSYEKRFNNDKVDFEVVVRSKELYSSTNVDPGTGIYQSVAGISKSYTITSTDNYLGNTPQEIENTNITRNIIIGKTPKPRTVKLNKTNFPFIAEYKNNVIVTGKTSIDFIGYDEGMTDYDLINYNSDLIPSFIDKTRYKKTISGTTVAYLTKENKVYSTKLYKDILAVVPEFSSKINNYKINDIVKVTFNNYNLVTETNGVYDIATGSTVERLYVCIEDITTNHLCKINGVSTTNEIHPIYRPNGARASFIPIEKYDVKSFSPVGYDKYQGYSTVKANLIPYRYRTPIILNGSPTQTLNLGDIVKVAISGTGVTTVFGLYEYVYHKPIMYDSNFPSYFYGDYAYHKSSNYLTDGKYSFWFNKNGITTSEPGTTSDWFELPITGTNGNSPFYSKDITGTTNPSQPGIYLSLSPAPYRVKNLIPTISGGTGYNYYLSLTGATKTTLVDTYPNYIPTGDTNGVLDGSDLTIYYLYTGSTNFNYTGVTSTKLTYPANQITNLVQNDYTNAIAYTTQAQACTFGQFLNMKPLFETLATSTTDDGILDYTSGSYNGASAFNYQKYTVNRNVLYRLTVNGSYSATIEPYNDSNWEEADFMLANKFTFYKDRVKVKIYTGVVESLNTITKNNLYFFDSNLKLKTGFTTGTFSGATIDNQLVNGLNKLADAKNSNLKVATEYGLTGFRKVGSDIIMDYYFTKDGNNLPRTGEFIGGLTINNPCGHSAKVIFGVLFDAKFNDLRSLSPRTQPRQALPALGTASTVKPFIRLIVNQDGVANVTVTWTMSDGTTTTKVIETRKSLDEIITVDTGSVLAISFTYDTNNNLTLYKSGTVDTYTLYDNLGNGINNSYVTASASSAGKVVTRTINLKEIYENRVVTLNFEGAKFITTDVVSGSTFIKLK